MLGSLNYSPRATSGPLQYFIWPSARVSGISLLPMVSASDVGGVSDDGPDVRGTPKADIDVWGL